MVKPTNSTDAIVSTNRFAVLGSATFGNQNRGSLFGAGNSAAVKTTTTLPGSTGAISKNSVVKDIIRKPSEIPGLCFASAIQGKLPRDRSNSIKRKNSSEDLSNPKSARLTMDCPHLKVIDENKSVFKKVLDSLSDYSGKDQVICDAIRDLSIGMNGINDILGVLMAERLIPGESPEIIELSSQDGPRRRSSRSHQVKTNPILG